MRKTTAYVEVYADFDRDLLIFVRDETVEISYSLFGKRIITKTMHTETVEEIPLEWIDVALDGGIYHRKVDVKTTHKKERYHWRNDKDEDNFDTS